MGRHTPFVYSTILTSSRSPGIGNGLTYEVKDATIAPGSLVRVPLRRKSVEGIVLEVSGGRPKNAEAFAMKEVDRVLSDETLLTPAQIQTLRWMAEYYCCTLRQAAGVFLPSPPWSKLITREDDKKDVCIAEKRFEPHDATISLTPAQDIAYTAIKSAPRPSLLFGVTGSGKTEIYARLIADAARAGKQSILLVPEILLTEHIIHRFEELFPRDQIAILHSRLTPKARREEWQRIKRGDVALVIGSRSALFAPCRSLGVVIIDEEHEWTYKNEQAPRYHARETAEVLCKASDARLVLGSATPSLESWARAKEGKYQLVRLMNRFSGLVAPQVRIIDLGVVRFGNTYPFSPPLLSAIRDRLQRGEQSILFLNRRGMATSILCLQCRRRVLSPASQLPYTIHRTQGGRPFLLDHITGDRAELPAVCPSCGSATLRTVGAGTQRLEDILGGLFPEARVLRADSDTLKHPEQMRLLLDKMQQGKADILLGTQAVVKGLHLAGVTLAAVLLADIGLSIPHFRAGERVFQLLTQLTGRSGREKLGEVIIQTLRPDAPEVLAAAHHRTEEYLDEELKVRTTFQYPPATRMIRLLIASADAAAKARALQKMTLEKIREQNLPITATCAPTLFGAGKVWHILLRGEDPRVVLNHLNLSNVTVDVDPVECV